MTDYGSLAWAPTMLPTSASLLGAGQAGPVAPTLALPAPHLQSYWQVDFRPATPVLERRRRVPLGRMFIALILGGLALAVPVTVTGVAMIELGTVGSSPAQDLPGYRPAPAPQMVPVACCKSAR